MNSYTVTIIALAGMTVNNLIDTPSRYHHHDAIGSDYISMFLMNSYTVTIIALAGITVNNLIDKPRYKPAMPGE